MKKFFGIAFVIALFGLFSCNNDTDLQTRNEELIEKSAEVSLNEVKMEAASTELEYEVEFFTNMEDKLWRWWNIGKRFKWNKNLRYLSKNCPDVEVESEGDGYPKVITLDYGDSTVLRNGTVLSGIIEITITAPRDSTDYERSVQYLNFGVDSLNVNGFSTVTVDKEDATFRMHESDMTFVMGDGTEIHRTSERIWQWIAGMETDEDQSDDVIIITVLAEATMTIDGSTDTYKKETVVPLKRIGDCRYIVEGVVEVTLNGTVICSIDYGNGTCDEIAVMTDAEGNETEIDLSTKKFKGNKNNSKGKKNSSKKGNQSGK